jgi:hypothetical protein
VILDAIEVMQNVSAKLSLASLASAFDCVDW